MIVTLTLLASSLALDEERWEPAKLPSWAFSSAIREQSDTVVKLDYDRPISAADLSSFFTTESTLKLGATLSDPPAHSIRVGSSYPTFVRETNGLGRAVITSLETNGLQIIGLACITTARHSNPVSQFRSWLTAYKSKFGLPKYVHVDDGVSSAAEGQAKDGDEFSYCSFIEAAWVWDYPNGKSYVLICRIGFETVQVYVDHYVERGQARKKTYRIVYPAVSSVYAYEYERQNDVIDAVYLAIDKTNPSKKSVR
jgi:hypothetical protein